MGPEAIHQESSYTYNDYLSWDESQRWEIIGGEAYLQATPSRAHQHAVGELFLQIGGFLRGKSCKAYVAPFSVRLHPKADGSDDTVLEPDLAVICDPSKLDDRGCNGAPDWIIEVLSPTTAANDRVRKLFLYQEAGVREYWIVDLETRSVMVFLPEEGVYRGITYREEDTVESKTVPGLQVQLVPVFLS